MKTYMINIRKANGFVYSRWAYINSDKGMGLMDLKTNTCKVKSAAKCPHCQVQARCFYKPGQFDVLQNTILNPYCSM